MVNELEFVAASRRRLIFVFGEMLLTPVAMIVPLPTFYLDFIWRSSPWAKWAPLEAPWVLVLGAVGVGVGSNLAFRWTDRIRSPAKRSMNRGFMAAVLGLVCASAPFVLVLFVGWLLALLVAGLHVGLQLVILSIVWSYVHNRIFERDHLAKLTALAATLSNGT